jgi:hypothetical protein
MAYISAISNQIMKMKKLKNYMIESKTYWKRMEKVTQIPS